jgi:DNA polymerase III delta prime subunit
LETTARNSPCFFCVNKLESVAEPIVSRCKNFGFDVAALKDDKLVMLEHHGMTENDWKDELRRVGRIVAKKAGYKIDEKIEDKTLSNNIYCVDARMYINEIGEQYDMKSFYSKSFTE